MGESTFMQIRVNPTLLVCIQGVLYCAGGCGSVECICSDYGGTHQLVGTRSPERAQNPSTGDGQLPGWSYILSVDNKEGVCILV